MIVVFILIIIVGSDGPASAAEDEASEQQIGTLKSIDENDGDEDYILNGRYL